jgi:hypothetical protein
MKFKVAEVLNRWPAVGLAVGVVRNGSLEWFSGHGVADIGSKTPATEDTVFRIASISKTFTAIAVMQLWEQRIVDPRDGDRGSRLCVPHRQRHGPLRRGAAGRWRQRARLSAQTRHACHHVRAPLPA